jgi:predicted dehydrogenase
MARTFAECQSMIAACQQAGVPLFVAYYRRCLPAFLKIKELVENEAIGAVRAVTIRLFSPLKPQDMDPDHLPWRVLPEIAGGGYFYDLASHQLDYLDYLFGPVSDVAGLASNQAGLYPAEDIVTAAWSHAGGVMGSGTWCFSAAPGQSVERGEIIGSRGRISFSFFEQEPVQLETESGLEEFTFPRQDPIQLPLIRQIVDDLRGVDACPSTGESAARTNQVLENMIMRRLGNK